MPAPLPVQAPAGAGPGVPRSERRPRAAAARPGRDTAPAIAEHARQNLVARIRRSKDSRSPAAGRRSRSPTREALTAGVAAWIRELIWAAGDHDAVAPDVLLRELTWDRRHIFQSAGLFDQMPWKVM